MACAEAGQSPEPPAAAAGPHTLGTVPGSEIRLRRATSHAEFVAADELYARVFGYEARHLGLNANLLGAMVRNGGSAVGAFHGESMVGFAYGFPGTDTAGSVYHYSQAAVVDPAYQGYGLGRSLKAAQAEVARAWGHTSMRWTFDPLLSRNAHFNFTTLGAVGIDYLPDYYARPGTDRILVGWDLTGGADPYADLRRLEAPGLTEDSWGLPMPATLPDGGHGTWVALPDDAAAGVDPDAVAGIRARLAAALTSLLSGGHVLVACQRCLPGTSAYLAVPDRRTSKEQP